jgi:hypothetical protein
VAQAGQPHEAQPEVAGAEGLSAGPAQPNSPPQRPSEPPQTYGPQTNLP